MQVRDMLAGLILTALVAGARADETKDGPRTGFFRKSMTTVELVFISPSASWSGSRRSYNDLLEEQNLIWAGVLRAGDATPLNERMMKSLLTPIVLSQDYALDPDRIYVGGYWGGAHVAMLLATGKPGLFKGGMFVGNAIFWGDETPPEIDVIRQNRYTFIAGHDQSRGHRPGLCGRRARSCRVAA